MGNKLRSYFWLVPPILTAFVFVGAGIATWHVDTGRGQVLPAVYNRLDWWDYSVLSNFLGIIAQVIGFIITITLTGVFMVGQHLGERLPPRVVTPLLRRWSVMLPLVTLMSILIIDVWSFYITSKYFRPVTTAGLVVAVVLLVVPGCLYVVARSLQALNVYGVISALGDAAQEAVTKRNPERLAEALEDLDATVRHAIDRGNNDVAVLTFTTLMTSVKNWSQKLHNAFEVLAGTGGQAHVKRAEAVLTDGQLKLLDSIAQNENAVLYGVFVRELAVTLPSLESPVRRKIRDKLDELSKSDQLARHPDFLSALLGAADITSRFGIEKLDYDSFHFGTKLLSGLWNSANGGSIRVTVLHTAARLGNEINKLTKSQDERKPFEGRLNGLVEDWGKDLVVGEDEELQRVWVDTVSDRLHGLLRLGNEPAVENLVETAIKVYGLGVLNKCSGLTKAFPDAMRHLFGQSNVRFKFAAQMVLKLETCILPAIRFGGQEPLSYLFMWLHTKASDQKDEEVILEMVSVMSMFLRDESKTPYALAFWPKAVAVAEEINSRKIHKQALGALFSAINGGTVREFERQSAVLRQVGSLLTSKLVQEDDYKAFLSFCTRKLPSFEAEPRDTCIGQLEQLTRRIKEPKTLLAAVQVYESTALRAIEEGNESLARLVSNSLGWLAHAVIVADDMALPIKEQILRPAITVADKILKHAEIFSCSRPTRVFFATLFVVLGAMCVESRPQEKGTLMSVVLEGAQDVSDVSILRDALTARTQRVVDAEPLNGKGEAPYHEFFEQAMKRISNHKAAVSQQ